MFKTFEDILDYDKYFNEIIEYEPYKLNIYNETITCTFWKNKKTLKKSLGIRCKEIFYYKFLEIINKYTFNKYIDLHITIDENPSYLSFYLTYDNDKLSIKIQTIGTQGLQNRFLQLLKPFLLNLPINTNILNIRSETYRSCSYELNNLPFGLELLIIRNCYDGKFVNDIKKLPLGCEIILSDEL